MAGRNAIQSRPGSPSRCRHLVLLAVVLSVQLLLSVAQAPNAAAGESAATRGRRLVASSVGGSGQRIQGRKLGASVPSSNNGTIDILLSALHYLTVAESMSRNGECSGPLATAQKSIQDSVELLKDSDERHAMSKIATALQTVKLCQGLVSSTAASSLSRAGALMSQAYKSVSSDAGASSSAVNITSSSGVQRALIDVISSAADSQASAAEDSGDDDSESDDFDSDPAMFFDGQQQLTGLDAHPDVMNQDDVHPDANGLEQSLNGGGEQEDGSGEKQEVDGEEQEGHGHFQQILARNEMRAESETTGEEGTVLPSSFASTKSSSSKKKKKKSSSSSSKKKKSSSSSSSKKKKSSSSSSKSSGSKSSKKPSLSHGTSLKKSSSSSKSHSSSHKSSSSSQKGHNSGHVSHTISSASGKASSSSHRSTEGHSSGFFPGGPTFAPYGNPMDDCWMSSDWRANPKQLANCAVGFGKDTRGGQAGDIYVVTTNEDDLLNPRPGSLRYGMTRAAPLWIVFAQDMTFTSLKAEMLIYSHKTIDARGKNIMVGNGPCFAVEFVTDVIIHGVSFRNCWQRDGNVRVATGPDGKIDGRSEHNGYGVYVYQSSKVWIDHCYFNTASDTQVNVIMGSTDITVSNNFLTNQNKVMLLGHNDFNLMDRNMRVTVMLNKFGPNCNQRMPRGRFGQFDVVNNYYPNGWGIYAIGGSAAPFFRSEANFFVARDSSNLKEVTKHDIASNDWNGWKWQSVNDHFENGAFFTQTGGGIPFSRPYSLPIVNVVDVPLATSKAGPLF